MKKLILLCALLACLVFWTAAVPDTADLNLSLGSIQITAAGAVQNGETVTAARYRILQSGGKTANTVSVSGGHAALILCGLNVESADPPLSVSPGAAASVTLEGSNSLWSTGSAGVRVPAGASLTLGGEGSLTAVGRNHSAGIGGGYREDGGKITVTGGTVNANGAGAGLGGGTNGKSDITITGGTVNAGGSGLSAGIGGGFGDTKVTITGGTVTARGASNGSEGGGAGIGNCNYGSGAIITITGGTVTATGGPGGGAGIGSGDHGAPASVHISNATVTATGGGYSAGIGGGARTAYDQTGGDVRIENASVTVTGYYSAIGGGSPQNSHGCSSILMENSTVNAACKDASGILFNEKLQNPKVTGPLQHSVAVDRPTGLEVTAQAPSGFTCHWQVSPTGTGSWEDLPGTSAVSEFSITREMSGKYFRCLLTNTYGSTAYAGPVRIYALSYSLQPQSVRTALNTAVTLTAASDTPNVTWHWERSTDFGQTYLPLAGETGSSLSVSVTEGQEDAFYRCGITGTSGHVVYSAAARVCIDTAPCYYRETVYRQELDGTYSIVHDKTVQAAPGARASITPLVLEGFAKNPGLGQSLGTVREDCSLVLSAYYDRLVSTISFETWCGTAPEAITAMYGAAVTLPQPTAEGGEFVGWFLDAAGTAAAELTEMPAQSTVLYARWLVDENARGLEYRIGGMILEPSGDWETATVPSGPFTARIFLTNFSSLCEDQLILTVCDRDGRLAETVWMPLRLRLGQTGEIRVPVENADGTAAVIRAFILSSEASLKPLSVQAVFGQQTLEAGLSLAAMLDETA